MKKIAAWGLAAALVLFILDWGVLGVKLLGGSYDVLPEAYIGAICLASCSYAPYAGRSQTAARIAGR